METSKYRREERPEPPQLWCKQKSDFCVCCYYLWGVILNWDNLRYRTWQVKAPVPNTCSLLHALNTPRFSLRRGLHPAPCPVPIVDPVLSPNFSSTLIFALSPSLFLSWGDVDQWAHAINILRAESVSLSLVSWRQRLLLLPLIPFPPPWRSSSSA